VDYALTIAISVAAGASAVIAYLPGLAPARVPLAVTLLLAAASSSFQAGPGLLKALARGGGIHAELTCSSISPATSTR
jgi:hypothetical protein